MHSKYKSKECDLEDFIMENQEKTFKKSQSKDNFKVSKFKKVLEETYEDMICYQNPNKSINKSKTKISNNFNKMQQNNQNLAMKENMKLSKKSLDPHDIKNSKSRLKKNTLISNDKSNQSLLLYPSERKVSRLSRLESVSKASKRQSDTKTNNIQEPHNIQNIKNELDHQKASLGWHNRTNSKIDFSRADNTFKKLAITSNSSSNYLNVKKERTESNLSRSIQDVNNQVRQIDHYEKSDMIEEKEKRRRIKELDDINSEHQFMARIAAHPHKSKSFVDTEIRIENMLMRDAANDKQLLFEVMVPKR